jgi:hypothetical protein
VAETVRSSAISPSGDVRILLVKPLPGPVVKPVTMFAPKRRSFALVVVDVPLLLVPPLPVAAAVTSSGLEGSAPEYSRIRISGEEAALEKTTFTVFVPGRMFLEK